MPFSMVYKMHKKSLSCFSPWEFFLNFSMIKVARAEEGGEGAPEGADEEESGH